MNSLTTDQPNPLVRLARSLPAVTGSVLSFGGRLAGSGMAAALAFDQTYDRTRVFAFTLAALALITCAPLAHRLTGRLAWVGAGLLFFGGALLAGLSLGLPILLCGAFAALGAAIEEQHHRRRTDVPSFFMGFGLIALLVTAIVLGIEG